MPLPPVKYRVMGHIVQEYCNIFSPPVLLKAAQFQLLLCNTGNNFKYVRRSWLDVTMQETSKRIIFLAGKILSNGRY